MLNNAVYKYIDYSDPFDLDTFTRCIHLYKDTELTPMDRGALLSRYSRSSKSMVELLESEFQDKDRGADFYRKVLLEFGDDSVAELSSEQIGIEGLSLVAATKLTDRRIGISFLEKSTRYMQFKDAQFYTPAEVYEAGLVEDFKELCALSHRTFNFILSELSQTIPEQYPISNFSFPDGKKGGRLSHFDSLSLEDDIKVAGTGYNRAVRDKALDHASYCWIGALKTNIGLNANCRSLEYMLTHLKHSPISELNDLGFHLHSLLSTSIEPFITRVNTNRLITNPLGIYGPENSIVSLYKHNITALMKTYDEFDDGMKGVNKSKQNMNVVKNILSELGTGGHKVDLNNAKTFVNQESFKPSINIINFMNEKHCIDTLSAAILYENNENLLDYDDQNSNNIDQNLRILDIDNKNIKQGILYDLINGNKNLDDFNDIDTKINRTTENTLDFNDIMAFFEEDEKIADNVVYQDYDKSTINKQQEFLINRYMGGRQSRRDKLGRAFEFIDYTFELSSSWKIMRDLKRHRIGTFLYPAVVTARNSYDSYIFPDLIMKSEPLFEAYKHLITESFKMYNKIVKNTNNYHAAQYANVMGTRVNYVVKQNFRELDYWLSLRSTAQGHPEYRLIAQGVYNLLKIIHPNLCRFIKFIDLNDYPLGRLQYEYRKEKRLRN